MGGPQGPDRRGPIAIDVHEGQPSYVPTERNGVTSMEFGPYRRRSVYARRAAAKIQSLAEACLVSF